MSDEEALRRLGHDARAPLVVIAGFAQLLETDADVDATTRRDYAGRIAAAAQELQALLDDRLP